MFQTLLYQHLFDIITLSETWLRNDINLLLYAQIPGHNFCCRNQDEKKVGSVGLYIKCTIKYKERQDLSKLDGAIEHMWAECQGTNKK